MACPARRVIRPGPGYFISIPRALTSSCQCMTLPPDPWFASGSGLNVAPREVSSPPWSGATRPSLSVGNVQMPFGVRRQLPPTFA